MAIRRTWLAIGRGVALLMLTSALLIAGAVSERAAWAQPAEAPSVESIKKSLDEIEQALGGDDITADTLGGFRQTLNSAMDALPRKSRTRSASWSRRSGRSWRASCRRRCRRGDVPRPASRARPIGFLGALRLDRVGLVSASSLCSFTTCQPAGATDSAGPTPARPPGRAGRSRSWSRSRQQKWADDSTRLHNGRF